MAGLAGLQRDMQDARAAENEIPTSNPKLDELNRDLAKVGLQQYDQELNGALDRVARLGPWEKSLQYDAAVMGLAVAGHLSPLGREALYRAMEQSLTMQTKDAQQTLMAQFKLKNLCADLEAMDNKLPNLSRHCAE